MVKFSIRTTFWKILDLSPLLHNSFYIATVIRIIQLNVTTADEIHLCSILQNNPQRHRWPLVIVTKLSLQLYLLNLGFSLTKSFYFNACSLFDFMLATVSFFYLFHCLRGEGLFRLYRITVVLFMIGL